MLIGGAPSIKAESVGDQWVRWWNQEPGRRGTGAATNKGGSAPGAVDCLEITPMFAETIGHDGAIFGEIVFISCIHYTNPAFFFFIKM